MNRFAILGVSILLLASCSSTDPWAPDVSDIEHTAVYVTNFSAERILEVYLRPTGTAPWVVNWLTGPISGGNLYTYIGQVLSGRFDVRMVGEFSIQETPNLNLVGDDIGIAFHVQTNHSRAGGSGMTDHGDDLDLRTILETSDLTLVSMAEGILEGAEIRYLARGEGLQDLFGLGRLTPVNPISGPVVLQVEAADEARSRELLADLIEDQT